jgi:hypothetical protein
VKFVRRNLEREPLAPEANGDHSQPLIESNVNSLMSAVCTRVCTDIGAESFAVPPDVSIARHTPGLAAVIEAWDRLPEAIRAGIVAMVNAASDLR